MQSKDRLQVAMHSHYQKFTHPLIPILWVRKSQVLSMLRDRRRRLLKRLAVGSKINNNPISSILWWKLTERPLRENKNAIMMLIMISWLIVSVVNSQLNFNPHHYNNLQRKRKKLQVMYFNGHQDWNGWEIWVKNDKLIMLFSLALIFKLIYPHLLLTRHSWELSRQLK